MNKEPLDFCRVKKIHEKGFGFLTSLYYENDIFFHFSKIRDDSIKETLSKMERGKIYLYYTSQEVEGKRRVRKFWFGIADVPQNLVPGFIQKIKDEFNTGKTNPYELAFVVRDLLENKLIDKTILKELLKSKRVRRIPNVCLAFMEDGNSNREELENILKDVEQTGEYNTKTINSIAELIVC